MSVKPFSERLLHWRLGHTLSPMAAAQLISQSKSGDPISSTRLLSLECGVEPTPEEKFLLEYVMLTAVPEEGSHGLDKRIS
jgi:hypothetical protein